MADKPYYPLPPIGSISVLASILEVNEKHLTKISENISSSYTTFEIRPQGKKPREVSEPKEHLKHIQRKLNAMIFSEVVYPSYLMGGISDKEKRDYVNNGKLHLRKKTLINLDIENFFPSISSFDIEKVFLYLFKFPPAVSKILTELTTLNGRLPQGGCNSTYLANLLLFNYEYSIVSKFRSDGITYSRLLDDITLSSDKKLDKSKKEELISAVNGMIKRFNLNLRSSKTKIEHIDNLSAKYEVTGTWVRFGEIKFPKQERKKIRSAVKKCETMYKENCYSEEYHEKWNHVSGKVAQLKRFGHINEEQPLRKRLTVILPLYNNEQAKTLSTKVHQLINRRINNKIRLDNPGLKKQVLVTYHQLGILARNNPSASRYLKDQIRNYFGPIIKNPYY